MGAEAGPKRPEGAEMDRQADAPPRRLVHFFVPRSFSMTLDELIGEFDRGLRSMTGVTRMSRPVPQPDVVADDSEMTVAEQGHAAGLMRVNHVSQVCAQALYQAHKLWNRSERLKQTFDHA